MFELEKRKNSKKKNSGFWGTSASPPRGTHISASGALIQNRLDESSNLVQEGMHAKFQPNRTIRLVRARGVVRFLTPHFVIGRCLYTRGHTMSPKSVLSSYIHMAFRYVYYEI